MQRNRHQLKLFHAVLALVSLTGCTSSNAVEYGVHFHGEFHPSRDQVVATISVTQARGQLIEVDLAAPADQYIAFDGDGTIRRDGARLIWLPPDKGGKLSYRTRVTHKRRSAGNDAEEASTSGQLDAQLADNWAVLRLDDVFPSARVRSTVGAESNSTLTLSVNNAKQGPWAFESRYGSVAGKSVDVTSDNHGFSRPTGWLVAGELGVRRETIAGTKVIVAAPVGTGFRRMDILTFLGWTLPELITSMPRFSDRILIVGAPRHMWRGGLSGPDSLYIHIDRPLVSENGTSTLLHELIHVGTRMSAAPGDDWIVEGLAEYFALVVLRRSGGQSSARYDQVLATLRDWVDRADGVLTDPSSGANTARAVLLFHDLDMELQGNLDVVLRTLPVEVSREALAEAVARQLGRKSRVLAKIDSP